MLRIRRCYLSILWCSLFTCPTSPDPRERYRHMWSWLVDEEKQGRRPLLNRSFGPIALGFLRSSSLEFCMLFSELPIDILHTILEKLYHPLHLGQACRVNRLFKMFAPPLLYEHIAIFPWHKQTKAKTSDTSLKHIRSLLIALISGSLSLQLSCFVCGVVVQRVLLPYGRQ